MSQKTISVPKDVAKKILKTGGVITCPFLSRDKFVKFCKERGRSIDRVRLLLFEKLGLFCPSFRVKTPDRDISPLEIPIRQGEPWFKNGWAWDTTSLKPSYEIPDKSDREQEAYYSRFQIYHLDVVLSSMTLPVRLDEFLASSDRPVNWDRNGKK